MDRPAQALTPTVECPVSHVRLPTAQVDTHMADGISVGIIHGHLSIYLVHSGTARFIHLGPEALDVVAGLLAAARLQLNRQECPSLETVQ